MNFNEFMNGIDFSEFKRFFLEKGKPIEFKKRGYFVRQNEPCKYVGWVESGVFRYTRIDDDGNEHIVGYSFTEDFVCDYPSFIKRSGALTNIQAATDCSVYMLSIQELNNYWENNIDTQRFGRLVAEEIFITLYKRMLGLYCDTAEQRYIKLLQCDPNLLQYVTLKEVVSFIGVTPETISHIRRRLRQNRKS